SPWTRAFVTSTRATSTTRRAAPRSALRAPSRSSCATGTASRTTGSPATVPAPGARRPYRAGSRLSTGSDNSGENGFRFGSVPSGTCGGTTMSADDLVQLRHLGSRLGFELIDELAALHARLDAFKDRPEARGASALMPLMDSLVQAGMKDRNDIYGWSLRGRIDGVLVNFRPGGAASYGGGAG